MRGGGREGGRGGGREGEGREGAREGGEGGMEGGRVLTIDPLQHLIVIVAREHGAHT